MGEAEDNTDFCVRLSDVPGTAWDQPMELDVYGTWCPVSAGFDGLRPDRGP